MKPTHSLRWNLFCLGASETRLSHFTIRAALSARRAGRIAIYQRELRAARQHAHAPKPSSSSGLPASVCRLET